MKEHTKTTGIKGKKSPVTLSEPPDKAKGMWYTWAWVRQQVWPLRDKELDQSLRYEPRFFLDRGKMFVVMSRDFQAMTVAGDEGFITRMSYLLKV